MKKGSFSNIILILMFVIGLSLLLYPSFSDYWNSFRQTQVVNSYKETVAQIDDDRYADIMNSARAYNRKLLERNNAYFLDEDLKEEYEEHLNITGNGIMGYIEIPKINVYLPVYHGTDEGILQGAIGHLEWTSLPTGGESTHCVISGHRGLPSARLFTDLDQLEIGNVFQLNVLDEVFTYQIDQIKIVEPHETNDLLVVEGEDYCTLVTCTPYGINSHRMLVRGTRIDNLKEIKALRVTADAVKIDPVIVAPIVGVPIVLFFFLILMIPKGRKKEKNEDGSVEA